MFDYRGYFVAKVAGVYVAARGNDEHVIVGDTVSAVLRRIDDHLRDELALAA